MLPRMEPAYPSFTLVLNEAFDSSPLPQCDLSWHDDSDSYSAHYPVRFRNPLMTTVDYRYDCNQPVPTMSWDDLWEPNQEASNLQVALDLNKGKKTRESARRRRFSDLVVDLAVVIKRKCSVRSLLRQRKAPLTTLTNIDLAS